MLLVCLCSNACCFICISLMYFVVRKMYIHVYIHYRDVYIKTVTCTSTLCREHHYSDLTVLYEHVMCVYKLHCCQAEPRVPDSADVPLALLAADAGRPQGESCAAHSLACSLAFSISLLYKLLRVHFCRTTCHIDRMSDIFQQHKMLQFTQMSGLQLTLFLTLFDVVFS